MKLLILLALLVPEIALSEAYRICQKTQKEEVCTDINLEVTSVTPFPTPTPEPPPTPKPDEPTKPVIVGHPELPLYFNFTFANQPPDAEFNACGLKRIPLVTDSSLFGSGQKPGETVETEYLNSKAVPKIIEQAPSGMAALNVEGSWDVKLTDTDEVAKAKLAKYELMSHTLRDGLQGQVRFGFYGLPPLKTVYPYSTKPEQLTRVREINQLMDPVAKAVDVFFPQLYTFGPKYDVWKAHASGLVGEVKKYGKLIIPFIWMQYHDRSTTNPMALLPKGMFKMQLEHLRSLRVDGALIWGTVTGKSAEGKNLRLPWDPSLDWWQEVKEFQRDQGVPLTNCKL